ncbi:protein of unknown function DUF459 [Methylocella silvestris BL2]|uniref:Uncharacterized protein n=2 Tax=Methylocella silvestris TaxID=199596 RepID=B8EMT3_METSB|nr:protein of unknown function DUF459 [Methylocella silvestris BL2]
MTMTSTSLACSSGRYGGRLASLALALCLAAATLASVAAPAAAQENPFSWFTNLFQPAPQPGQLKRRPEIHRPARDYGAPRAKRAARSEEKRSRPVEAAEKHKEPTVPPSYFVAVLGDSLGQMLGQGLTEAFADRPDVAILHKGKDSSGLVRDDFYDWTKAVEELLASDEKINVAVIMIGSNDRQSLRDAQGGVLEPRTPQWNEAYGHRIETIAAMFRDKKIPLIWAGLPVMKSERLSTDASAFNDLYREYAGKGGAKYVDLWEAFATEGGAFSPTGPDVNGEIVKLRAADGVHFTKAGARKLAHFIEPDIRHNLDETIQQQSPESPAISAPAEANLPAEETQPGASEGEPPPPAPKPIAGPVLPLTGPVRAPGGELASRTPVAKGLPRQSLRQSEPQPGRADDFSWPRN